MTRQQFIQNVEGTQKAFRRFLVALCCGDTALADDIAQEAYLKAYLCCDGLSEDSKFNAWLFRIGYNAFVDHKRSAKVYANYDEARTVACADTTVGTFRYQALYLALNKLPAKERTTVLLFYMEGYSVKEIAAIVDASQEAVRQQLSRGRGHLRTLLSNQ